MGSSDSHPPELAENDIQFILDNSEFTRTQINEWYSEFIKECPKGYLNRHKFQEICQQKNELDAEIKQYCKFAFKTFDTDNNRRINFPEFILAIEAVSSSDFTENLRLAFRMCDKNKNGLISKSEMRKIIKALYKLRGVSHPIWFRGEDTPRRSVNRIFERHDSSKDNSLSEKEFIHACTTDPMIRTLLRSCSV